MKKYYFKEKFFKITDHYPIIDEDGKKTFFVDQTFKFLGYEAKVSDAHDKELFTINRKLLSFLPIYYISFSDKSKKDMTIRSNLAFFKKSIDILMEDGKINLKGNFWDYEFKMFYKGEVIGEASKKIFSLTDQYELKVLDENFSLELIALCLALNNIKDLENASYASNG